MQAVSIDFNEFECIDIKDILKDIYLPGDIEVHPHINNTLYIFYLNGKRHLSQALIDRNEKKVLCKSSIEGNNNNCQYKKVGDSKYKKVGDNTIAAWSMDTGKYLLKTFDLELRNEKSVNLSYRPQFMSGFGDENYIYCIGENKVIILYILGGLN